MGEKLAGHIPRSVVQEYNGKPAGAMGPGRGKLSYAEGAVLRRVATLMSHRLHIKLRAIVL